MPGWMSQALDRIHSLSWRRRIWFTHKAMLEMAGLGMDERDARQVLLSLARSDSRGRVRSKDTGEWMYVFKPRVAGMDVYVKLLLRAECVVVSFHMEHDEQDG